MKIQTSTVWLLLLLTSTGAWGQVNSSVFYSSDHNLEHATYFPSQLGMDRSTVQVDLAGAYGYLNNGAFSFNYARRLFGQAVIRNEDISQFSGRIADENHFFVGAQFRPVEASVTFNDNLTVALGTKLSSKNRLSFGGKLLDVIWNGNAKYAGQEVNLGTASALFEYPVEIYTAAAMSFPDWDNLKLRAGIRPKLIMSYAALQIDHAQATMFTEENGKYIDVDYSFLVDATEPLASVNRSIFSHKTSTFTVDLGATAVVANRFHFSASLLDVGRLKYSKDVKNYQGSGSVRFEGAEVVALQDGVTVTDSSLAHEFDHSTTTEPFTTPLPARVGMQAFYRVPQENRKGEEYYKFSAGVSLVQGLSAASTFGDNTFLSIGGNYNPGGILNIGTSLNTYNFDRWGWGLNASVRLFIFHLGFGTTNLAAIFSSSSGLYSDFHISGGLNF